MSETHDSTTRETEPVLANKSAVDEYYSRSRSNIRKVRLKWDSIDYRVILRDGQRSTMSETKHKELQILNGNRGSCKSGQMIAILGPSGSGKTSLMNVLAGRVVNSGTSTQQLLGNIHVNGAVRDINDFRKISSYVLQDDALFTHLTVYETLYLAAEFFLSTTANTEEKQLLVAGIIAELGLNACKNTIIGDAKYRGISGGERKRTAIAQQMITNPSVMFMDEPTTGLDSFQALSTMECINRLAANGRLVITVIHQPRSQIFALFDKLLLLSQGRDIFFGNAKDALSYFTSLNYNLPKKQFNPSDFFLDILSIDTRGEERDRESRARVIALAQSWLEHNYDGNEVVLQDSSTDKKSFLSLSMSMDSEGDSSKDNNSINNTEPLMNDLELMLHKSYLLAWRAYNEFVGDWIMIVATCVISSILALIIGGIYSGLDTSQRSIQNRNGLLFFLSVNLAFNGCFGVLNSFPKEKVIILRERSNNAYSITSYFISKFLIEMPVKIIPGMMYSFIVYFMVGLQTSRFGEFFGIVILQGLTAVSLGYAISTTFPTIEAAQAVGPLIIIICILFGGFYISVESLPIVADLIPWISFVRWSFQSLMTNEYRGLTLTCTDSAVACKTTGEAVLESLHFDGHTTAYSVFGLGMCCVGFLVYTYISLLMSNIAYNDVGFVGSDYVSLKKKVDQDERDNGNNGNNSNSSNNENVKQKGEKEVL